VFSRSRVVLSCALGLGGLLAVPAVAVSVPTPSALTTKVLAKDLLSPEWRVSPVGAVDPAAKWDLGVTIAGRNDALKDQLFKQQNDPKSANYHRYLTPAQYTSLFAVDPATTAKVRSWITSTGMQVTYTDKTGSFITVTGTAAQAQSLTKTTLTKYKATQGGGVFIANAQAPTVPVEVTSIGGLDTLSVAHTSAKSLFPLSDISTPATLEKFYNQPTSIRGGGQKLAAFGWGAPGSVVSDLAQFQTEQGLPHMPLNVVQVGGQGTATDGLLEWNLDSQAASGMAPNASSMTFYFATEGQAPLLAAAIKTWADDPSGAQQASGSYGLCEVFGLLGTFDAHEDALRQAALEGRTFFASTGDNGAGCSALVNTNGITIGPIPSPEYPATSVYSVAVGGTVAYFDDPSGTRDALMPEIAWTHGGGGPSYLYSAPAWQTGNLSVLGNRLSPDVSAQSGDLLSGYSVVTNGADSSVGGTSLSAPLWQGMWARVTSAGATGFAAPQLWAAADKGAYYDVTVGSNGLYAATPGYDLTTGWGTPDVKALIKAITNVTAS
jgi:subtilase family serine protease